jgi:hypothetical protein
MKSNEFSQETSGKMKQLTVFSWTYASSTPTVVKWISQDKSLLCKDDRKQKKINEISCPKYGNGSDTRRTPRLRTTEANGYKRKKTQNMMKKKKTLTSAFLT